MATANTQKTHTLSCVNITLPLCCCKVLSFINSIGAGLLHCRVCCCNKCIIFSSFGIFSKIICKCSSCITLVKLLIFSDGFSISSFCLFKISSFIISISKGVLPSLFCIVKFASASTNNLTIS